MRTLCKVVILGIAMAMTGCEVEGPVFQRHPPTSQYAVIYVYRPYHYFGSAIEPDVTCGHSTAAIGAGGYHAFVEEPGIINCYSYTEVGRGISFEARPEAEYFVREEVDWGFVEGRIHFYLVNRGVGLDEIQECRQGQQ